MVFASPNPNKVLHDMTKKGLLERLGWGKYKVNSPEEYVRKKTNITEAYALLKNSNMHYSLTGPDAVFFWTKGGYQVDRFFGFFPIHIKIKTSDLGLWIEFFNAKKEKFHIKDQPLKETLFGIFYVIYSCEQFQTEIIDEFQVDLLQETVEFCQNRMYSYEPALEMLDQMYNLGLNVKYQEVRTNFK